MMLIWTASAVLGGAILLLIADIIADEQARRREKDEDATVEYADEVMRRVDCFLQEIGRPL